MSILDQYGSPATSSYKLVHASDTSRLRGPQFRTANKSLDELITERDRDVIVSLSQRLYLNLGPMKSVVDQKAMYSVGEAWQPSYDGPDMEKGNTVKHWMRKVFLNTLDVRGGQWDWEENLKSVSYEIDVRGDHFTLLTESDDGRLPKIQNIPAFCIKTKGNIGSDCKVIGGTYDGKEITNGIIYDKRGKPLAYRMSTGSSQNDYRDLPAASVIHSFDPALSDGKRGLPVATCSLEDLKHVLQSTEYERTRQLILSSIGLFVENDTGGPDVGDPRSQLLGPMNSSGDTVTATEVSPSIWYAKAGDGEKITQLKNEAGGDTFESFHDRMIRSFCAGANWSYSLTWKPTGQGTAERGEIMQSRKSIIARQKRLQKWAIRVITYAYSFMAERGELPTLDEPFNWSFTKPPRLSVDDGREAKMLENAYRLGSKNMSDLLEAEGTTFDAHLNKRAEEAVKRKVKIQEVFEATGIKIDERELVMFTPNETADESNQTTDTDNETTS